jgi:hypothetical protein
MKATQVENCILDAVSGLNVVDDSVKAAKIIYDDAESVPPSVGLTPLKDLTTQINNHHRRALNLANSSIDYAVKCGKALVDAKAQLSHGEWMPWLQCNCPGISPRQAQKYKRLAENWVSIQAIREINPEAVASVEGTLSLIAEPNANSNSHLHAASDETLPDDDSMTDSNTTSGRNFQPSQRLVNNDIERSAKDSTTGEPSDHRVSETPVTAAVDTERKQTVELQKSVKKTVTNHLRPKAEIIQVSVAKLNAHKVHEYVYGEAPDQGLVNSIEQFGILEPLMVSSKGKVIVSGHGRWEAAKQLGMETVPVMYVAHRYDYELTLLLIECNRQRVKTSSQEKKEALQLNVADSQRRHWERREIRKAEGESAEPLE